MSNTIDLQLPTGLNSPEDIILNYTSAYGDTQITFAYIDQYYHHKLQLGISFGLRIGMAFMTLFIVNLISKNKRTPIYILNQIVLVLMLLHSILYCVSMSTEYSSMAYYFSLYDYVDVRSRNVTVCSNVFYLLLIASVETSMTFQAFIIFKDPFKSIRWIQYVAVLISGTLGLTTTGFYFAYVVMSNRQLYDYYANIPNWLLNVCTILFGSSSFVTSMMSAVKLGYTIRKRQFLGLKQFSIFHILFVMGVQTMIIPTIMIFVSFVSFQNSDILSYQALSNVASALITISLPATTMWANSRVTEAVPSSANDTYLSRQTSNTSDGTYRSGMSIGRSSKFTMAKSSLFSDLKNSAFDEVVDTPDTVRNEDVESGFSSERADGNYTWRDMKHLARDLEPNDLNEDYNDDEYLALKVESESLKNNKK